MPPKPKVVDGLRTVREVCETTFKRESFKESMRKCFVGVGLAASSEGKFVTNMQQRKGSLAVKVDLVPVDKDDTTTLGEVAAELEMVQREGHDSDDEGEVEQLAEEEQSEDEDDADDDDE